MRAAFGTGAKPTAPKTMTASGDWGDFAGAVVAECSNADVTDAPVGTFVVSNSLPNVAVHVGNNAQVFLAPNATEVAAKEVSGTTVTGSFGTSAGKTLTVGTLSGRIRVSGEGEVLCTSIAPGTTLANDRMVTYPDAVRAKALKDSNTCVAAQFAGADGIVDVGALVSALSGTTVKYQAIGATDGARLANVPGGVVLEASAKILVESATSGVGLHGDGTLAFGRAGQADWTNSVDFWFDFSRTETFRKVSYAADSPDPAKLNMTYSYDGKSCPVFERCVDWRFPEREGTLWNGLYYAASGNANANYYPIAATNTYQHVPDMTYMTFGDKTSGRLPFGFSKNTANDGELTDVNYVVMVFSSRLGGGEALVADEQSYFQRERKASAEEPIHPFVKAALPDGLSIRADGWTMENPEETCPNGDWQIVTIKMKGRDKDDKIVGSKFRGIGFRGKTKTQGCGQSEYGEVMLFTNDVPLLTVLLAERHLARKWNIASYNEADLNAAVAAEIAATTNLVSGVGSSGARIDAPGFATVRVTGDFAGEISLDGGSLIVDGTLPWTEAQVAAVGNRCFWLDGDDASSVKTFGDYKTSAMSDIQKTKIRIIKNKTDADYNSGPLMWGANSREPYRRYEAHRFGPVRGWIDFFEWTDDTAGNTLRMVPTSEDPNPDNIQNVAYNMSAQTIVMAHDSTWGGGNPVYDSTSNDGHFGLRFTTDPRSQVWKKGSRDLDCAEFRDGINRIDGVTQANSNGFGGQAEVYAVRGTGAIETRYFVDSYQNSEPSRMTQRQASCVGEILYYSTALDDATISGIESYLMNKWLGILPSGYGDVRRATVKGDGTVEVADLSRMPNIASDFTGTVRVAGTSGELTMTVDADARQVNGALVNADALFELPASATIHVKFANSSARKTPYRYRLIDAAGTENTIWTVDLSDPSVPRGAVIVREGNKVFLDVTTLGLLLIVK